MLQAVFKSNERSEDSYIGVGGFLFSFSLWKSLKICLRSILIFRGLNRDLFSSSVHFYC